MNTVQCQSGVFKVSWVGSGRIERQIFSRVVPGPGLSFLLTPRPPAKEIAKNTLGTQSLYSGQFFLGNQFEAEIFLVSCSIKQYHKSTFTYPSTSTWIGLVHTERK